MNTIKFWVDVAQIAVGVATVVLLVMTLLDKRKALAEQKELALARKRPLINVNFTKTAYPNSFPGTLAPYFLDITFLPCEEPVVIAEVETLFGGFLNGGYSFDLLPDSQLSVSATVPPPEEAKLVSSLPVLWVLPSVRLAKSEQFHAHLLSNVLSKHSIDRRIAVLRFRAPSKNIVIQVRITMIKNSIIKIETSNNPTDFSKWPTELEQKNQPFLNKRSSVYCLMPTVIPRTSSN